MRMRLPLALLVVLATGTAGAACEATAPFELPYRVVYGDMAIGSGSMAVLADRDGCAVFRLLARPGEMLRGLVSGLEEESHFCVDAAGAIRPQQFLHQRGAADEESYALAFDWPAARVRGGRFKDAELPDGALDPLSVQLHVRSWLCRSIAAHGALPREPLAVTLVDHKGVQRYLLGVQGQETIEVPAGRFATVRVDRIDATSKKTRFWLAPAQQFLIVRAQQQRGWRPALSVELAKQPP